MAHLDFHERQKLHVAAHTDMSADVPVDLAGLEVLAPGSPVQAEVVVSNAQVGRDDSLTLDIPCSLEGGERLIQQLQSGPNAGLVEHEPFDPIAHPTHTPPPPPHPPPLL